MKIERGGFSFNVPESWLSMSPYAKTNYLRATWQLAKWRSVRIIRTVRKGGAVEVRLPYADSE